METRDRFYVNNGEFLRWKVCSIEPMTEREAKVFQTNNGYIPMGYSFYDFEVKKEKDENGKEYYINTWGCYASCD